MNEGDIVEGKVSRIEGWGLFLEFSSKIIFVQIVELDWIKFRLGPSEFTQLGNTHDVKILGYSKETNQYSGSIKQAHPELDPWINDGIYNVGNELVGVVISNTEYGSFVEVTPGLEALVLNEYGGNALNIGDSIRVKILSSDMERRRMELKYVQS